jgi:hypothetical protein
MPPFGAARANGAPSIRTRHPHEDIRCRAESNGAHKIASSTDLPFKYSKKTYSSPDHGMNEMIARMHNNDSLT